VDVEIVENHVQVVFGKCFDDILEEAREVDRGAALLDLSHHLAAGNLQSRQQGLRTVADILVAPAAGFLGDQGRQGPSTVQRLNPRFFVDTQYQRIFRRIQIQADNIQQLGLKIGIRG
jgi:hypothetical protein